MLYTGLGSNCLQLAGASVKLSSNEFCRGLVP